MNQLHLIPIEAPTREDVEGRDPFDRYFTPEWATRVLLDYLGTRLASSVWEPCAGAGDILRHLSLHRGVSVAVGSDIAPSSPNIAQHDFLSPDLPYGRFAWIITNPPYTCQYGTAADIIRRALEVATVGVAALVRLSFLEPTEDRRDLLPDVSDILVLPRVHYIHAPNANPSTSIWLVWDKRRSVGDGQYRRVQFYGPEVRA